MRRWMMVALLGLVACTGMRAGKGGSEAASASDAASGTFAGEWEACHGPTTPDECGRYQLLQRGDRICGTWFYFATGKEYRGRIIARVDSPTEGRRTHVCGRPGSETDTECENGWQTIDKPLRICKGKLSTSTRTDGSCFADYQRVPIADEVRDALRAQPWMLACLSGDP